MPHVSQKTPPQSVSPAVAATCLPPAGSSSLSPVAPAEAAGGRDNPVDDFDDAAADRWNDAALAAMRGQPCPGTDADSVKGYEEGLEQRKVRVVMPARPEGYYHAPLGSFE